jgi:hypothetical protein
MIRSRSRLPRLSEFRGLGAVLHHRKRDAVAPTLPRDLPVHCCAERPLDTEGRPRNPYERDVMSPAMVGISAPKEDVVARMVYISFVMAPDPEDYYRLLANACNDAREPGLSQSCSRTARARTPSRSSEGIRQIRKYTLRLYSVTYSLGPALDSRVLHFDPALV